MSDTRDPFALSPQLWFGLLCEGFATDQRGRLNFTAVFNQVAFFDPPKESGVAPHGFINGILALGFSEGLGHFTVALELRNVDGHTLWRRPEPWEFDIGPSERSAAVLVQQVRDWVTQPGRYHYWIRLEPTGDEHVIQFEVGRQIGPAEVQQHDNPHPQ